MHRFVFGLGLAVVVAGAIAPAVAAPLPTSARGMLALVTATKQLKTDPSVPGSTKASPYVSIVGAPEGTNGGTIDAAFARRGALADGTHVLAIPLDSGGSGGVFVQILFAQKGDSRPRFVGYLESGGGHLGVRIEKGAILAVFPDYGASDQNCCPSHFVHQTYTLARGRLQLTATNRSTKP
jgi:hypothetical protein